MFTTSEISSNQQFSQTNQLLINSPIFRLIIFDFTKKKLFKLNPTTRASKLAGLLKCLSESKVWDESLYNKYRLYIQWLRPDWPETKKTDLDDHYHFWNQLANHSKGLLQISENLDRKESKRAAIAWQVALDSFRSGYNTGSVIRTADAFMWEKVILGGYTPGPGNKSVCSAAMGSQKWVSLENAVSLESYLKNIKSNGGPPIFGLELGKTSIELGQIHFPQKGILVLGNEERGIQANILKTCDYLIEIPNYGRKFSMNVASAFAIAAYTIRFQLDKKTSLNALG